MSGADFTLYRRMRGVFWGLLVIGVVALPIAVLLAMTVPAQLEIFAPSTIDSIGNTEAVASVGFGLGGVLALIAAVILGSTAGSVDLQRGVLRDLILTGRSRPRIVLGRLLAAFAWLVLAVLVSYASTVAIAWALAPISSNPDWEAIARIGGQFLPGLTYTVPLAAGIALMVGSRGPAIAIYFVFALVIDNVLVAVPKVGEWWQHVSLSQADQQVVARIVGESGGALQDRPLWQAMLVLAAWALGALVIGLVRLGRRDL